MNKICVFCNTSSLHVDLGRFYEISNYHFHSNCLIFSSDIRQNPDKSIGLNGFEKATIELTLSLARKRRCYGCGNVGATVKCAGDEKGPCDVVYHFPCALETGTTCHEYFNKHQSYCYDCIPYTCIFDYDRITGIVVRTDCCLQVYSHDYCIEKYVGIAKALTKCPLCYDETNFRNFLTNNYTMKISTKDPTYAKWDVAGITMQCVAEICICPESGGRFHHEEEGNDPFELIDCFYCGSEAIHQVCGDVGINREWVCQTCDLEPRYRRAVKTQNRSRIIMLLIRIGLWLKNKLYFCLNLKND